MNANPAQTIREIDNYDEDAGEDDEDEDDDGDYKSKT